jgi:hypothetical protein
MPPNNDEFDFLDPTGMVKEMRNSGMEAWSKMMVDLVNTDAYSEATGKMLNVWLSNSAPFREAMEKTMTQTLATLNLPNREEVTRLAQRMTNIEMKLDDIDAKLDACLSGFDRANNKKTRKRAKSDHEEDL